MLGTKLLWTGLTFILAVNSWNPAGVPAVTAVGAIIMILGAVLLWLHK